MLVALYVDPVLGGYLVAFALIGHAVWDVYRYLRNRVVARSYAGWCAVVDPLVGAAILLFLAWSVLTRESEPSVGCYET